MVFVGMVYRTGMTDCPGCILDRAGDALGVQPGLSLDEECKPLVRVERLTTTTGCYISERVLIWQLYVEMPVCPRGHFALRPTT